MVPPSRPIMVVYEPAEITWNLRIEFRFFFFFAGDLMENLVPHPEFKMLGVRNIPQMSENSLAYSTFTWAGLLKHLRQMLISNAKMEEGKGYFKNMQPTSWEKCLYWSSQYKLAWASWNNSAFFWSGRLLQKLTRITWEDFLITSQFHFSKKKKNSDECDNYFYFIFIKVIYECSFFKRIKLSELI